MQFAGLLQTTVPRSPGGRLGVLPWSRWRGRWRSPAKPL